MHLALIITLVLILRHCLAERAQPGLVGLAFATELVEQDEEVVHLRLRLVALGVRVLELGAEMRDLLGQGRDLVGVSLALRMSGGQGLGRRTSRSRSSAGG